MKIKTRSAVAALLAAAAVSAFSAVLPLGNAGFESPALLDGDQTRRSRGW